MSYKKYIVKNGKTYGPYTYYSRRVNGKVISEYKGKGSFNLNLGRYKAFAFVFIYLFIAFLFILGGYNTINHGITGKSALNLETIYNEGEPLQGALKLSLKQGELLPVSTHVLITTSSGKQYDYLLSDLITEQPVEGNFYIEGKELVGSGDGYGISGLKTISPAVYFTLEVSSQSSSTEQELEEGVVQEPIGQEGSQGETPPSAEEITSDETQTETTPQVQETTEQIPSEESIAEIPPEETPVEEPAVEPTTQTEEQAETPTQETPITSEEPASVQEASPITGNVIFRAFGGLTNIFKRFTGQATADIGEEISASITADEPYILTLSEGQTVSLKSGSVKTDSKQLSDNDINLEFTEDKAILTTDYAESLEGFGQDYLTETTGKQIRIDLNNLGLEAEPGELDVSLIYGADTIINVKTTLVIGETAEVENKTILVQNATSNETINYINSTIERLFLSDVLSEDERKILIDKFGEESVNTTKAELFNDRLIVKHEIGDYWIEYSYDYKDKEISDVLEQEIERDMIRWLKDIARQLTKQKAEAEKIETLLGNKSIDSFEDTKAVASAQTNTSVVQETEEISEQQPVEETSAETSGETTEEISEANVTETTGQEVSSEESIAEIPPGETPVEEPAVEPTTQTEEPVELIPAQETPITSEEPASLETPSVGEAPVTGDIIAGTQGTGFWSAVKEFFKGLFG